MTKENITANGTKYKLIKSQGYLVRPVWKRENKTITICVPTFSIGRFSIRKETFFDNLAKGLGIAVEVQTENPDFDSSFYIDSSTPDYTEDLLSNQQIREEIKQIFEFGRCKSISLDQQMLSASFEVILRLNLQYEKMSQDVIDNTADLLQRIATSLPRLNAKYPEADKSIKLWIPAIVKVLIATMVICSYIGFAYISSQTSVIDKSQLFEYSSIYSLSCFFLCSILVTVILSRRSSSHRELLILLPVSFAAFLVFGYLAVDQINQRLDTASPVFHEELIMTKDVSRSKNTCYYLNFTSWRKGHSLERIMVSKKMWDDVKGGDTKIRLLTKPGYLSFEWIVSK